MAKSETAMNDVQELLRLVEGGVSSLSIVTYEEHQALELIRKAAQILDWKMRIWSAGRGSRDGLHPVLGGKTENPSPEEGLKEFCNLPSRTFCVALDLGKYLQSFLILRMLRDTIHRIELNQNVLVLIDSEDCLPECIRTCCRRFDLSLPSEEELENVFRNTLRQIHNKTPLEIGLSKEGLKAIIRNLRGLSIRQARRVLEEAVAGDRRLDDEDVNRIIAGKRRLLEADALLEYVEAPLTLDEIGGMKNLKQWLATREKAFSPQAAEFGLPPPRGVLILGVQGAGKSLCAKAIAAAWRQPLFRLDCGTLYNKYIGESENNLRKALRQIEAMSPAILWIDEIEKAFASAASQSTDGGLSKRMFATLLTWMQEHKQPVFLVATANDIEALPPELLRKGRFDEIFFVGLPGKEVRQEIFAIHLKKRKRKPEEFELEALADAAEGFTGSEIEQAVLSALYKAFHQKKDVDTDLLLESVRNTVPLSVTMRERMEALYQWAQGRVIWAD